MSDVTVQTEVGESDQRISVSQAELSGAQREEVLLRSDESFPKGAEVSPLSRGGRIPTSRLSSAMDYVIAEELGLGKEAVAERISQMSAQEHGNLLLKIYGLSKPHAV